MDRRLFPNDILYCEGRTRTWLRGWFHFFMCITFFPLLLVNYISIFLHSEKPNTTIFIACVLNLLIIYIAHCMSAFYHICPLELPQEIIAQKMDIIGANLYVASSYLPMVFAIFPTNIGISLFLGVLVTVIWNIVCIVNSNYNLNQPVFLCLWQILFGYYIWKYFTRSELILNCSGLGALAIGAWFLIYEYIPFGIETPFFNSFEMYHGISVFCLMCTCLMNYSMFKRTVLAK